MTAEVDGGGEDPAFRNADVLVKGITCCRMCTKVKFPPLHAVSRPPYRHAFAHTAGIATRSAAASAKPSDPPREARSDPLRRCKTARFTFRYWGVNGGGDGYPKSVVQGLLSEDQNTSVPWLRRFAFS